MKNKCECGREIHIPAYQRKAIRAFLKVYPWVTQKSMAILFNASQARISEIVRSDIAKGGL
jgi:hypothetical protein